jgi:hypothetical protein
VIALAMTLNELCTNTTKFGALSVPAGSVDIAWKIDKGMERLQLTWCEKGGPSVRAPSGPHDRGRSLYYGWPLVVGIPCRQDFAPFVATFFLPPCLGICCSIPPSLPSQASSASAWHPVPN